MVRRVLRAALVVSLALVAAAYYGDYEGDSLGYNSYGGGYDDYDGCYYGDCGEDRANAESTDGEGKEVEAQVTSGEVTQKGYMIALYRMLTPEFGQHVCGGFLYTPPRGEAAFVVTSAQCVRSGVSPCKYKAVTNLWDLNEFSKAQDDGQVFDIVDVAIHPGFQSRTLDNDIAILRLGAVPTGQPSLNLFNRSDLRGLEPGSELIVLGWGSNTSVTRKQGKLLKGEVQYDELEECRASYAEGVPGMTRQVTNSMLCTVATDQDACLGDTGGPVVQENGRTDLAVGIISWGAGCAETGKPSVHTSIAQLRGWMDDTIARMAMEDTAGRCY
mmetsp:Transcript_29496/g.83192  ORF Transcript_29496/g.83192 Transcript_29496/m.83192 type:complete len:329 (+) Transcript_29496:235-1221(+)|eukprot:CAMPEP_0117677436 /NCGR_PEP_ID=MMETSP0804-20121206/16743_1 /TAXON_ID=1074897 /ORGANISM="Tetraselmis astigmatica, Strain CCMP880" /LENGTH=328 /DNA_ID=CAMNT_0005486717 /DNA_START=184 /DNA_END=1173 /DNA_ORIENTATION=+